MPHDEKLHADMLDLIALENAAAARLSTIRRSRDEIQRRIADSSRTHPVTEHAVIRYLERVEGMDIEAIRDRIREELAECTPEGAGESLRHPDGHAFVVAPSGNVVTVLGNDMRLPDKPEVDEEEAAAPRP